MPDADNKYLLFSNHLYDFPWPSVNHQLKGHEEPRRIGRKPQRGVGRYENNSVALLSSEALCGLSGR